ncbi:MAG: hypothetical protein R3E32_00025 [Chitinophagales bacterium]
MPKKIVLAIPTVLGRPENELLKTLESIFSCMDEDYRRVCCVFVLDAELKISPYIEEVKVRFADEIAQNVLIIEKTNPNDYPHLPEDVGDGYNRWMVKQNIDFSILLERAMSLGEYVVQLDDDIRTTDNFVKYILNDISYLSYFNWIAIRVCPLGTIGAVFKSNDLPPIINLLREKYTVMPVDLLQEKYIEMKCQKEGRFFFRIPRSLFQHVGLVSTSAAESKKYYQIAPANFEAFYIHDLGVGRLGCLFRPMTHLLYRLKKMIHSFEKSINSSLSA